MAVACAALLGACDEAPGRVSEPELIRQTQTAPPGARAGTCWGKKVTPARVETVTHQIMVQPPEVMADGTVRTPAIYRTATESVITRERSETWFETPCEDQMTPEFVASLQRALKVRGLYRGAASGRMDGRTRAAIRRFQKPRGLDSGILTLKTARSLGLAPVPREDQPE
jgi:hypothetical protein